MKSRTFRLITMLFLVLALALPTSVLAQNPAYQTTFTTSITYMNVDTAATTSLIIQFYPAPDSTDPIDIPRPNLAAGAGTSVFIGSLSEITPGFQGAAVILADRMIVSTLVQVPQNSTTVKNRPLSNGFASGSPTSLIATVLKNTFNATSRFSVQNTDTQANNITIHFYNTSAVEVHTITGTIQPGGALYVDAGTVAQLGASFNGSAVVEAERTGGGAGSIVSSAMELSTNSNGASAFEGVAQGGMTVYMPSALCNAFGGQNSSYAVQNTSLTTDTDVTVTFSNGAVYTQNIGPGAKKSFITCDAPGMTSNFSGSATVVSTDTDVIAIGKVYGLGLSTAFVGAANGAPKLALPYVRWSETQYASGVRQRAFIAIQNIGAPLAANAITVHYMDKNGVEVATHTINAAVATGAKVNSNPYITLDPDAAEFGYYTDGSFGGSALIDCNVACDLVAVVRVQSTVPALGQTVAEDFNGIPVP
jgi:hypothetical protein